MSETELLHAFRENRSEEAFAHLVRRYAGLVYSVAKRRLANAALAEDVTQIVFIRFAQTPPKINSPGELAAWLHRTTRNVTIDAWRSESRRRSREEQAIVMESNTQDPKVWEELSPLLDEALNDLNEDDRQTLLLRFFGQKSMRDVGAALGVSEDAAKMRVSRALERLRTKFGVGGAACTVAVLGALLTEHAVEAAPGPLIARLSAMELSAKAGAVGIGGLLGALLRMPKFNLVAGVVVLAVVGFSLVQMVRSFTAPIPKLALANPSTNPPVVVVKSNDSKSFDALPPLRPEEAGLAAAAPTSPPNTMIAFQVLDAETGTPLAGTEIHAAYFGAGGMGESHDLLTDASGAAAIPEPDDATKNVGPNVFVTAEGHVPKVEGFRSPVPADYTIRLDPALTAGGLVVDEAGLPVAGVKIMIQGPGNKLGQIENIDFQTCPVTNHEDGSWSCSYVPRDFTNEIRFILKKPGYAATFPVVPVARVDLTNLVLVINRGFTIVGQVVDEQNQPVVKATIKTLAGDHNKPVSARTDKNGRFILNGVSGEVAPGGEYLEPPLETNSAGGIIIWDLAGQGPLRVDIAVQAEGYSSKPERFS
ncbi:MAG: sigma-70 family RNA polymerase sigma factor [Verrucomicrobiae bacterium]|nr:sigma-70 family RNA polymerase sigma factor [Verrucomicrobiae bacterium]